MECYLSGKYERKTKGSRLWKRGAENPIFNTLSKITQAIFSACKRPTVICLQLSYITIIQSHGCKEILISLCNAKKIADAVLLCVFNIGFPASLFDIQVLVCFNDDETDYKLVGGPSSPSPLH